MNEKLTKAKSRLVLRQPFFASILLGCRIVEDPSLNPPTMATDGTSIYFHPAALDKWSVDEVAGVLAHETLHIAMCHPWRRGHRQPKKSNHAMDYAINGIIEEAGLTLPSTRLRAPAFDGKSFEEIYTLMPDAPDGGGQGQGGAGDQFDNVMDAPGTEAERQQSEAEAHVRIKQAANQAKAQGKLPAGLSKLVDEVLSPKIDWRAELRRYMTAVLKTDQSWQRGQRRFLAQGLYLPAFHTPGMGEVVVGIDTSGSIVDEAAEFLAEVQSICEECKPEKITLIQLDAKVQSITEHEPGDPLKVTIKGGGGTDMRALYPAITGTPAIVLLCTDGATPWGDAPDYPHLTVTTSEPCPYGDNIKLVL